MYAHHWGLKQDPFSIAPDPHYLFMSQRHREALAHLLYGVAASQEGGGAGGGFVLLTGDIGTGKTTICRCFLAQIPPHCRVAYIFNPKLSVLELLQTVCDEFHLTVDSASAAPPTVKTYVDTLNRFLLHNHAQGRSSVLIIDEAQNLHTDVLEQLRLLTNLETNERKLLQIVLIGQPELRAMLERPALEQLAQRVIARYHLAALSADETRQYIAHRLAVAGHSGPLPFSAGALRHIHRITGGVPRRINLLCARALLGAWANALERVNAAVVKRAATEVFGLPSGPWSGAISVPLVTRAGVAVVLVFGLLGMGWWGTAALVHEPAGGLGKPSVGSGAVAPVPAVPLSQRPGAPHPAGTARALSLEDAKAEPMETVFPQLPRDVQAAWRLLAMQHQMQGVGANPCVDVALQPLQCVRSEQLTLPVLRQLGRAGILTLHADHAAPVYAVLVGLDAHHALLRVDGGVYSVPLSALMQHWRGQFASFWHPPPGYSPLKAGGSTAPLFAAIARQLDRIEGVTPPTSPPVGLDGTLRARVQGFQRSNGLVPDGQPGPLTLMQLEIASGTPVPATARLANVPGAGPNP